jgi:hypothetical protein
MPRNEDNQLISTASLRRPSAYEIVKEARCFKLQTSKYLLHETPPDTSSSVCRASLKEPSRPFTPGLHQRSLLSTNDYSNRPSSAGLISRWAGAGPASWETLTKAAGSSRQPNQHCYPTCSRAFQDGGTDSTPWDGSTSSQPAGAQHSQTFSYGTTTALTPTYSKLYQCYAGADIWQAAADGSTGDAGEAGLFQGRRRSSRLSTTDAGPSTPPHPSSAPLQRLPTTNLFPTPSSFSSGGSNGGGSIANPLLAHQSSLRQQQQQQQQQSAQRLGHSGSFNKGHSAPPRYSRLSTSGASTGPPALPLAPLSAGAVVGSAPRRPDSGALSPVANPLYQPRPPDAVMEGSMQGRPLAAEMAGLGLSPRAAAAAAGPARILGSMGGSSGSFSSRVQQPPNQQQPMGWEEQQRQGVSSPRPLSSHSSSDGEGISRSCSTGGGPHPGQPASNHQQQQGPGSGLLGVLGQLAALPVAAGPGDASRLLQACAAVQVELDLGEGAAAAATAAATGAVAADEQEEEEDMRPSSSSSSSSRRCSRPGGLDSSDPTR